MTDVIVQQAMEKSHEIEERIKEFFDRVNDVLSWVPGFLADLIEPIVQGMEALRQKVEEFWERVRKLWEQPGDPGRLRQVGTQWVEQIGNGVGDVAENISPDKLRTNWDWTGRAAEAYKATVPAQVSGLNSIKDLADQMKSSLSNLANSIENFWTAIIAAFVVFIVGAVGAVGAAVTVVGIPAAIAAVAGAAAVSIGLVTTAIVAMQSHAQNIRTEQGNIAQQIDDNLGEWAKSNIDALGHASVNDPDGTNWHINS